MIRAPARERGVALLIAMIILALGASITSAVIWQRSIAVERTALLQAQAQAYLYDLGAEAWVDQILTRSAGKNDTLDSPWAQQLPPLPIQGGALLGHVEDLQGRFNLNDLVDTQGHEDTVAFAAFQRLLSALGIDPGLADTILDWEDPDDIPRPSNGAETGYYSSLDPPYASANQPFVSPTSLLLIKGITPKIYERLAPYVAALPLSTPINVNTASAPVIAALVPHMSLEKARELVQTRGKKGFENYQQFQSLVPEKVVMPVSLASSFFLLQVTTTIGSTQLTLYSVLYRDKQGMTHSIFRSFAPI